MPKKKTIPFAILLSSLLILLVFFPAFGPERVGGTLLNILFSAVLIAGVYAAAVSRRQILIAMGLAICALVFNWISKFYFSPFTLLSSLFLQAFFVGFVLVSIFRHILRTKSVTSDTLLGAICVYLLMCLLWTFVYALIEVMSPGSFSIEGMGSETAMSFEDLYDKYMALFYYSFVTLTTLGFGDITPQTRIARSFTTLEAVAGQLYLTILVARLVGLHITQSGKFKSK